MHASDAESKGRGFAMGIEVYEREPMPPLYVMHDVRGRWHVRHSPKRRWVEVDECPLSLAKPHPAVAECSRLREIIRQSNELLSRREFRTLAYREAAYMITEARKILDSADSPTRGALPIPDNDVR